MESTVRFAAELGYEVTVVKDATADYSDEEMHAALDVNLPNYASAMVTTNEIVDLISSVQTLGISAQSLYVRGVKGGVVPRLDVCRPSQGTQT